VIFEHSQEHKMKDIEAAFVARVGSELELKTSAAGNPGPASTSPSAMVVRSNGAGLRSIENLYLSRNPDRAETL
jgi:hypothetical protein